MKADTHPQYYNKATVTCACGNRFRVGSTREAIAVEICSSCHPFFAGTEKVVDTAGRIDRFKSRSSKAVAEPGKKTKKVKERTKKATGSVASATAKKKAKPKK